jgi:ABC-2 type transport system ATP-binding protein
MPNEVVYVPDIFGDEVLNEDAIIWTSSLTKRFGHEFAVRDVTFQVPRGQIFGFIGPSGSGKTTTIRILTGYYQQTSGKVLVFNTQPTRFTQEMRERIGYMPQLFVLYPNLSVLENLNFAASIYGMSLARRKRLNELLDFVELKEHKRKLARDISGGMQRRLSLAATLVHSPELIFLDEPTAGVDPVLRNKFWDHFRKLRDAGRTLFITTQYVGEAAYCDLVGVMREGRLLIVDTPEGLRYRAYGGDVVNLQTVNPMDATTELDLSQQHFVKGKIIRAEGNCIRTVVDDASTAIPALLDWCRAKSISVHSIDQFYPPFDDVFIQLVKEDENHE